MSLNLAQRRQTSAELHENLRMSGLTIADAAAALDLPPAEVEETLDVTSRSRPEDVWALRDYLERAVLDAGGTPEPFSILTEHMRAAAESWFPLRQK